MNVDFTYQNEGTIVLLYGVSLQAIAWLDEHMPENAPMFGNAYVIEHSYFHAIASDIVNNGFTMKESGY